MKNRSAYLRGLVAGVMAMAAVTVSGCVPEQGSAYMEAPNMEVKEGVSIDFLQVHNDVMDSFDVDNPYIFITDCAVDGTNEPKAIIITATCLEGTEPEDAEHFAAAVIRRTSAAIAVQSGEYEPGDQQDFGNVWDAFSLKLTIQKDGAAEGDYILELDIPAGEEIPLDPDYETYEEEYIEQRDMRARNTVIRADS